ncbi:MAG: SDR family oxidoreductase [Cyclobacteriaceae bacterium]|jgi:NAD(P)-dependent dehydrogenase (short-subunit alcohol dehydrogenase family)
MKIALVTGAYKGLGFEWCRQLGKQGYKVILTARELDKAQEAADQLNVQELVIYPKALEVTDEKQIQEVARWAMEMFGRIDLIINNAGINPKDYADKSKMAKAFYLNDLDAKEMLDVLHINSIAPLLIVKHFRELLNKSDNPIVINISSWLGSVTNLNFGGHYGYVGSKNLLNVLNKSMANELKNENIISVNVNPGWVQTDMGGQKAQFTTEQAVTNILINIVSKVTITESGEFLNYDGKAYPW